MLLKPLFSFFTEVQIDCGAETSGSSQRAHVIILTPAQVRGHPTIPQAPWPQGEVPF